MADDNRYQLIVEEPGCRLDKYISLKLPDLSRSRTQKLIEEGQVTVNGKAAKASLKLEQGANILIIIPPAEPSGLEPEDIPLKILYEDDDLLVVDKPAGMTVHPAPGHPGGTLVNAVLAHLPGLQSGESFRPGIVHRLDKDTSGLLLVAKTPVSHMKLAEQFKNRTISKIYQALVRGQIGSESGVIEADIGRDPRSRQRMAVVSAGRPARTEYPILRQFKNLTLLEVLAHRTDSSIRVHLLPSGIRWWEMCFTAINRSCWTVSSCMPLNWVSNCPPTGNTANLSRNCLPIYRRPWLR